MYLCVFKGRTFREWGVRNPLPEISSVSWEVIGMFTIGNVTCLLLATDTALFTERKITSEPQAS